MSPQTHMHVRCRSLWYGCYEADEVLFKGRYDFTLTLPPVPAGTYEIRMFTNAGYSTRGIIQVYIDGEPQGIPFDMRKNGKELFGWTSDSDLGDDDAIAAFDKSIHNLGWMKGPKCYHPQPRTSFDASSSNLRNGDANGRQIRKIFGTFTTDGKTDHYLRIQQKMEAALRRRKERQPLGMPSCGSVFRNPEGASAGDLIERCGLKGARVGGAQISQVHANFIVNTGGASASDVATLMKRARDEVIRVHGIELQPEVRFLGFA